MLSNEWKALQNGSDIRGVALEGVEGQAVNLTEDVGAYTRESFCFMAVS